MNDRPQRYGTEPLSKEIDHLVCQIQSLETVITSSLFKTFLHLLYKDTPLSILLEKDPQSLHAIGEMLWASFEKGLFPQITIASSPSTKGEGPTIITVITKDSPFLVDSLLSFITQAGYSVKDTLHPAISTSRDAKGNLIALGESAQSHESLIYIELNDVLDSAEKNILQKKIETILTDVQKAVADWQSMRNKINDAVFDLDHGKAYFTHDEKLETQAFLQWLDRGYFTFLGYREYTYVADKKPAYMNTLGLLKNSQTTFFAPTPEMEEALFAHSSSHPQYFSITKTQSPSTVHRLVPMDVIRIKTFNDKGTVSGERQFFGLFTSSVYNRSIQDIPLLRKRSAALLDRCHFPPEGHNGKLLMHILESFPRDELFQATEDFLYQTTQAIILLKERQRVALFVRQDLLGHMVSCLIYVPRDRFSSNLREKFSEILSKEFNGSILSFQTEMGGDIAFARVHFLIATNPLEKQSYALDRVEQSLQQASMTWTDSLRECFMERRHMDDPKSFKSFVTAFSAAYQEAFSVQNAMADIDIIQKNLEPISIHLYEEKEENGYLYLKLYKKNTPLIISDILPILENMGLKVMTETPYQIKMGDKTIWLHHFKLSPTHKSRAISLDEIRDNFQESLSLIWEGRIENDSFNALVINTHLGVRDVNLLRVYFKYLKQINFPFDQSFVEKTLSTHGSITKDMIALFYGLFDPQQKEWGETDLKLAAQKIEAQFKTVLNANDDKILRAFFNLILATLRTNYFVIDPETKTFKDYISIKFDASRILNLPLPRPAFEIFVCAPWVEAIHLRGGKVARGGLRWSTRLDFRKEVLDLMKAQMVKNTVIIPVGAKGGFIIKTPTDHLSHEDLQKQGIFCYQTMIRGLLDVTDNLVDGKPVRPFMVRCKDDVDPYLVVAADKGTATFSDIANAISNNYQFWMGDAFASGGSVGYDHKKIGITAKGAWISVARHFREIGIHVQQDPFTVVGVGDMSGDVFGNGMLLSNTLKLVGAFNHIHIFLDPTPDPQKSFQERERLFKLPRSTWKDYNPEILSKGAMIIDRAEKTVTLTPEVKKLLHVSQSSLTPNEIIHKLLTLDVDLLWFGGIGTFVKASTESHEQAGDRINDDLRVNGQELRCKIIGEGANLGMTQRGRIEYARLGGRLNTDAIDNSAGVDCSDHEVNIKILLQDPAIKKILPFQERNILLEKMTEEVAALVLKNNYAQTQAISMIHRCGSKVIGRQTRLMQTMEKMGKLHREIEYLPDDKTLHDHSIQGTGLTRPEIAILLAYGKIFAFGHIIESTLPESPLLQKDLMSYFPRALQEKFDQAIAQHPLRREIVANFITNSLVNSMGPTFLNEMMELGNTSAEKVTQAYLMVKENFTIETYWSGVELLDNKIDAHTQYALLLELVELIERNTLWLLLHQNKMPDMSKHMALFSKGVQEFMGCIESSSCSLTHKNLPAPLGKFFDTLPLMNFAYTIIQSAHKMKMAVPTATDIFFKVHERFSINWLLEKMQTLGDTNWSKRALYGLRDQLVSINAGMMESIAHHKTPLDIWCNTRIKEVEKMDQLLLELKACEKVDLSMIVVAVRQLEALLYQTPF